MNLELPTTPSGRLLVDRAVARVVLADSDGRVLLIEDSDPGAPGEPRFWMTPGGEIEAGETPVQAAVRELAEETGLQLGVDAMSEPLATRRVRHGYSDRVVEQTEHWFAARVRSFVPDHSGFTASEQATVQGSRWWTVAELATTRVEIWPYGFAALAARVVDGDLTPWVAPMSSVDESTVPI